MGIGCAFRLPQSDRENSQEFQCVDYRRNLAIKVERWAGVPLIAAQAAGCGRA
jgi:hypothetical protein